MAANVYEGMFILDSNRYARDAAGVSGQIPEMIQKLGGEMLASRLWEERRLAYPVNGHRKGTYWLTYFKLGSSELANLNRQCQLSDNILQDAVSEGRSADRRRAGQPRPGRHRRPAPRRPSPWSPRRLPATCPIWATNNHAALCKGASHGQLITA